MEKLWAIVCEELGQLDSRLKETSVLLMGDEAVESLRIFAAGRVDGDDTVDALAPGGLVSFLGFPVITDFRLPARGFAVAPSDVVADRDRLNKWLEFSGGVMTMDDDRWTRKVVRV